MPETGIRRARWRSCAGSTPCREPATTRDSGRRTPSSTSPRPTAAPVAEFCAESTRLARPGVKPRVLGGVVRPMTYTGNAMHNFAYARRVLQQPGSVMPNAFLIPMSKTPEWWTKDWMERHTYFLPRYDDAGRMLSEGHALAAAAGVPCLLRRTYKHSTSPRRRAHTTS